MQYINIETGLNTFVRAPPELKFEQMMDKLERSSGQTVVTLNEAKLLLERHDDLVIAVYDYWLNKRLNTVSSRTKDVI